MEKSFRQLGSEKKSGTEIEIWHSDGTGDMGVDNIGMSCLSTNIV